MSPSVSKQNPLSGVIKIFTVVMLVCLGLWGCARRPAAQAPDTERMRALEARTQKLDQDLRAMTQSRDKFRQELAAQEEEAARVQKDAALLAAVLKERDNLARQVKASQAEREQMHKVLVQRTAERDDLRQQVALRINERDAVMSRCEKFRKSLQQLLTQDDNPASNLSGGIQATPTSSTPVGPALGNQG